MTLRFRRKLLREFARYFLNNGVGAAARTGFAPRLIAKALDFEYIRWPKRLEPTSVAVMCWMSAAGWGYTALGL